MSLSIRWRSSTSVTTLFISDLHLCAERPRITELFLDFLTREAAAAEALYILGDLFEYWIGDDALASTEGDDGMQAIVAALRRLTAAGVPVFVQHGNRDFLLGADFCAATGCELLPDPSLIDLYGEPTLLMHGDLLCTDDLEYQQVRRQLRDPRWIAQFLAHTRSERAALVRGYRAQSQAVTQAKPAEIMDVNSDAVAAAMASHGVRQLIHGHTHRPAVHRLPHGRRIVLGDWYEQGSVLACDADGCRLRGLPAPT